jgi:carboxyl-terminal processing protease
VTRAWRGRAPLPALTVLCAAVVVALTGAETLIAAKSAQDAAASAQAARVAVFDEVWQTVSDTFYDPTFGGLDWAAVRDELRPRAAAARSDDDVREVIETMLARLGRSHFALISASASHSDIALGGEATVDIEVRPIPGLMVITDVPADSAPARAGLKPGQAITAIDGRPFDSLDDSLTAWRIANARLHGPPGSSARITVAEGKGERTIAVPRLTEPGERVQFSNLPPLHVRVDAAEHRTPAGRRVGAIAFNLWMAQVNEPVAAAVDRFRDADGVVIDLRGNPGGLAGMIVGVAGHFVNTPEVLGTMRTRTVPRLEFVVNPRRATTDGRRVTPYAGPVAVLVDELTASASECFAGAMQDLGRVRVFGRKTMGQALPASTKRLSNGDVLEYVVGDFVTSTGRSLEGTGVTPDETQPLDAATLARGMDAPMAAALRWIDRRH